ncbi:YlzJ-like protein [Melghirimyces profundicolus]|uniref:YlzJ-like protein n=1 Tax=Melghirimyces profundicolus TaxID=1242148 RepID=A0A2T6BRH3_9BACL|nr:YlzJ-like family protein [Melghirimyces profundicolus]PTX58642.1 YlzJ-like protein [Melghirimyces profundicolus]
MIHYSVIPAEFAWVDPSQEPETREVEVEGVSMLVEMTGSGEGRIVRLFSTDPRHYLDSRYQPGARIHVQP